MNRSDCTGSNVVYSRVRLARNWDEYAFPAKLDQKQAQELLERLKEGLKEIGGLDGNTYVCRDLNQIKDLERMALRERRILNSATVSKREPAGLMLSEDEASSLILGGDDHIRIQLLSPGLNLDELWARMDRMDDYVNERFSYAFDDKYGYLTSFPTNVGTGLRACVVLHLPVLSQVRKFQSIVADMSRFGTAIPRTVRRGKRQLRQYVRGFQPADPGSVGAGDYRSGDQGRGTAEQPGAAGPQGGLKLPAAGAGGRGLEVLRGA